LTLLLRPLTITEAVVKGVLLPGVVAIAVATSGSVALAQGHNRGPQGGAMHAPSGPSGGAMRSAPSGAGPRGHIQAPRSYQGPRASRAERPSRPQRVQRSERSHSAERRRSRTAEPRKSTQQELRQNKPVERRAQERERASPGKAVEAGRALKGNEHLEQRVVEKHSEIQQARTRLGSEERQKLHRAFDVQKARVSRASFDHHVGKRIPRHVRLFRIPITVFAFFPYYRDYSYFVVDDDICIVDPRTYVVVDVIDAGYWSEGRPQVAEGLRLSARQIALVRDSIPPDFPVVDVRLRLALGAEIPEYLTLHEFAPIVLDRVPELREYRFLVTGDQIVIVHPRDRAIALVIDRR
jgi:Protein of unknown function (DUF1236)